MIKEEQGKTSLRTLAIVGIVFLFTIFMFQNTEVVEITFFFWRFTLSRILLLFGSLAIGFFIGLLTGWELFRTKKAQ